MQLLSALRPDIPAALTRLPKLRLWLAGLALRQPTIEQDAARAAWRSDGGWPPRAAPPGPGQVPSELRPCLGCHADGPDPRHPFFPANRRDIEKLRGKSLRTWKFRWGLGPDPLQRPVLTCFEEDALWRSRPWPWREPEKAEVAPGSIRVRCWEYLTSTPGRARFSLAKLMYPADVRRQRLRQDLRLIP